MTRRRLSWDQLPTEVRAVISDHTGEVVQAVSHEGGYSPGMAATLIAANGTRTFVKAVAETQHQRSAELYRQEAHVNALLPAGAPAPTMRWSVDDGDWVILAFDAADGELGLPWTAPDIERVLDLYSRLADLPAPQGLPTAADLLNEPSVQPSPPGIPHLRSFQRAQGEAALSWLRARLAEGL